MSPKGILIAFAIVSLLLIGVMFLVVDGRNNTVLEKSPITETSATEEAIDTSKHGDSIKTTIQKEEVQLKDFVSTRTINPNEHYETTAKIDSLKAVMQSLTSNDATVAITTLNQIAEDVIVHIKKLQETLFPGGLAAHDLGESPKVDENNAIFFKQNGEYSEQAKQLVAKIKAFENKVQSMQKAYPPLGNIKVKVRDEYTGQLDWLNYSFKDFPAAASHTKLSVLINTITAKQEAIIKTLLN